MQNGIRAYYADDLPYVTIRDRTTNSVLYDVRCDSARSAVAAAVADNVDLSGADLSGMDLSYAVLTNAKMKNVFAKATNLFGADLTGACLQGAYLCEANLSGARIVRTDLTDSMMVHALLTNSIVESSSLRNARLSHSKFDNVLLNGVTMDGVDLREAVIVDTVFTNVCIQNVILTGAVLNRLGDRLVGYRPYLRIGPIGNSRVHLEVWFSTKGARVRATRDISMSEFEGGLDRFQQSIGSGDDYSVFSKDLADHYQLAVDLIRKRMDTNLNIKEQS